jgi:hypothetical protein
MKRFLLGLLLSAATPAFLLAACGESEDPTDPTPTGDGGGGSPFDARRLDAPIHVDAACSVVIDTPAFLPSPHVDIGTPVEYNSNPPSSGPHYGIWAAFKSYEKPVDRRYYVHSMEHGAVVFAYRCDDGGGCPEIAAALQGVIDSLPPDPLCASQGARLRAILTPDPLLDVPIAAASWGWTYKADCIDIPSLKSFATEHYAAGPENFCSAGQTEF